MIRKLFDSWDEQENYSKIMTAILICFTFIKLFNFLLRKKSNSRQDTSQSICTVNQLSGFNMVWTFILRQVKRILSQYKGAYIKYVGEGAGEFYKFFKKFFVAQETIDLNISWPSNFFRKYFMVPPISILVSYLRLTCSSTSR